MLSLISSSCNNETLETKLFQFLMTLLVAIHNLIISNCLPSRKNIWTQISKWSSFSSKDYKDITISNCKCTIESQKSDHIFFIWKVHLDKLTVLQGSIMDCELVDLL